MTCVVKLVRCGPVSVPMPRYATEHAAGLDMHAALEAPVLLAPGERRLIPTGLKMEIPVGYEGQVRPRSGLALKHGISIVNSPGTIDADYRGEVGIVLINHGQESFTVQPLERIAQLVIAPIIQVELQLTGGLVDTQRGAGGYGSTGQKTDGS